MRGKRKRERSHWPTVQIPLDLFVYITPSLSVSPLLFPSLPLSFFLLVPLTQTPTCCKPLRTADEHTDSLNRQIILLLLNRNGTPTAVTCVRVNYSILEDKRRASCSTMLTHHQTSHARRTEDEANSREITFNMQSCRKSKNIIILLGNHKKVFRVKCC